MDMADSHHETFISTHKCKENDSKYLHVKKDRSEYFNKLFLCDALPLSIIEHYFPLPKWKEKIEQVWYHCRPFIEEVTKDSFIKYKCRQTEPFLDQLKRFNSRTTIGNKDSWLEMAYEEGGYDFCFGMWKGIDCTWSDPRITNTSIVGISTSSGKKIDDYQFHEDVIKQHPIPKDKKTKNLLKTQVKQLNHFGLDHFSYRDCLILSNPFLFPHPRLVKKLGIKNPIIDSPIKRVALAKEAI
jgi:hypothetical protein